MTETTTAPTTDPRAGLTPTPDAMDAMEAEYRARTRDADEAAAAARLARANEIVAACCAHSFYAMGLEPSLPPSLEGYTLQEMLDAQRLVREASDAREPNANGTRTVSVVCDDRLVAALYVLYNYEPQAPRAVEPVAIGRGVAPLHTLTGQRAGVAVIVLPSEEAVRERLAESSAEG